jgi:hypothetical protein
MSFQQPSNRPKSPALWHSELVKQPRLVTVKAVKVVKNGEKCLAELIVDGIEHVYWINKPEIKAALEAHIGQQVVLIGSGNDKQGTESVEVQAAGVSGATIPQPPTNKWGTPPPVAQPAPQQAQPTAPVHVPAQALHGGELAAKKFLCQASNLMRLCIKKAHDIKVEFDLPDEHRQVIASSLFIQADRNGHVAGMPIQPFTLEQLGVVKHSEPAPTPIIEPTLEEDQIPF